jgi:ATP-dependent protease Clp ATPase subunit
LTAFRKDPTCSFCRKSYQECGPLVEGPFTVLVCRECAAVCLEVIQTHLEERKQDKSGEQAAQSVLAKPVHHGIVQRKQL